MDALKIPARIFVGTYVVEITYKTRKGNIKKRSLELKCDKNMIEFWIQDWMTSENERLGFEAYSDLEIVDIKKTSNQIYLTQTDGSLSLLEPIVDDGC